MVRVIVATREVIYTAAFAVHVMRDEKRSSARESKTPQSTSTVKLELSDLKYVAYGRAGKGSLRAYFVGLVVLWVISIPAIVWESYLWVGLVVVYVALFVLWWVYRIEKRAKALRSGLESAVAKAFAEEKEPEKKVEEGG